MRLLDGTVLTLAQSNESSAMRKPNDEVGHFFERCSLCPSRSERAIMKRVTKQGDIDLAIANEKERNLEKVLSSGSPAEMGIQVLLGGCYSILNVEHHLISLK